MDRVVTRVTDDLPDYFDQFRPPPDPPRRSAVLMLFGPHPGGGEDVILTERAHGLRSHAAQVSFPGGGLETVDAGPIDAALREAEEEVGVDPESVEIVAELPALFLSPSGHAVTPVLGWWPEPGPIGVIDEVEVAQVARVPLAELLDPAHRFTVVGPLGYRGPAFEASGLFVWGFTAMLLSVLLDLADLTREWDDRLERDLPEHIVAAWLRGRT
ncbi:MAG: CoA pyrophosphatase [Actinomycetia bacterium]|nr:CoA pyrophosphatase [Actinomycetes bacterium]